MLQLRIFQILIGIFLWINLGTAWAATTLDKVVAIVNNSVITQSQLDTAIMDKKATLQSTGSPLPNASKLRQETLNDLIAKKIQLQVAERNKIKVTDAEVNETLNKIAKKNNLTMAQFKEALIKQGSNYQRFRSQLHDELVLHEFQQALVAGKIAVSDSEIRAYLKNPPPQNNGTALYHIEDLIIPLAETASAEEVQEAEAKAHSLLQQAQRGSSFADLAQESTQTQHQDLGVRKLADFPSIFTNPVQNMQVGAIKGPIRAPNGLHIIKLIEAKGQSEPLTPASAKNQLVQQKVKEQVDKWVADARKSAYVKIL